MSKPRLTTPIIAPRVLTQKSNHNLPVEAYKKQTCMVAKLQNNTPQHRNTFLLIKGKESRELHLWTRIIVFSRLYFFVHSKLPKHVWKAQQFWRHKNWTIYIFDLTEEEVSLETIRQNIHWSQNSIEFDSYEFLLYNSVFPNWVINPELGIFTSLQWKSRIDHWHQLP